MSVQYRPVQWNRSKLTYDLCLGVGVAVYLLLYLRLAPGLVEPPLIGGSELQMRALGTCAFWMLTLIMCIGPLARLDRRFLPILYNRRHFGVLTFFVAIAHLDAVRGWYLAFSPADPWVALLAANTDLTFLGFPFEWLGLAALAILFAMAATSHDFWLAFLTPPVWKRLHMLVYAAYGLIVMHVTLGVLQAEAHPAYAVMTGVSLAAVAGLHLLAAAVEAPVVAARAEAVEALAKAVEAAKDKERGAKAKVGETPDAHRLAETVTTVCSTP